MAGEDAEGGIDLEYFMEDISEEPSTRVAGAILIIIGSLLGVQLGVLLVSGNPDDILSATRDSSEEYSDVSGIVISERIGNDSGGEPVEGARVRLLSVEGATTGKETFTDSDGRFSIIEVRREPYLLSFTHSGNNTTKLFFVPGDEAQIVITMSEGNGENVIDRRGESYQSNSVAIGTAIALMTVLLGLLGVYGGVEAYRGNSYRRSWWLSFLGLWSRGMIFIGPLLILIGMGLVTLSKEQFSGSRH
ncbi:MAG: carboxypeptidase-like regulatory domain-containing protein [Candidatus Thermoplasmatota archaeon]|nr:carboxypeptidase-like regulatory domain-containing protein [Candidatus Thermoplasmatota archaeon]